MTDNIVVNRGRFLRADGSFGALVDVALSYTPAAARVAQEVARLADECWLALSAPRSAFGVNPPRTS